MGFFFKDNCQNINELCHKLRGVHLILCREVKAFLILIWEVVESGTKDNKITLRNVLRLNR